MATTSSSGNIKGFYRQRKNNGISKPNKSSKSSPRSSKKSPSHAATLGSDITQPAALISHGSPDINDYYDENEEVLRHFDMTMVYGPCLGITRLARWERACSLALNPPKEIGTLLKADKVHLECLWEGGV